MGFKTGLRNCRDDVDDHCYKCVQDEDVDQCCNCWERENAR